VGNLLFWINCISYAQ